MLPARDFTSRSRASSALLLLLLYAPACNAPSHDASGGGDGGDIIAAGLGFPTGARVVLWKDPGGYDAYSTHRHFDPEREGPAEHPARLQRYGDLRKGLDPESTARVRAQGWTLEDLQSVVHQVLIHYDACGTSRRCFEVLHDIRGLSCHFLLDLDGTVYQTLDLQERAWHAAQANDGSIGIEIAHPGAYASETALSRWYTSDGDGTRVTFPEGYGETGLPRGIVARPVRCDPVRGRIHGRELVQYDFTEEQYGALERLLVALCRIFPRIKARVPRDGDGRVLDRAFASDEELFAFDGILGHWHVTPRKNDPGPAFDWDRILRALEAAGIPRR